MINKITFNYIVLILGIVLPFSCNNSNQVEMKVYETSASGNKLTPISSFSEGKHRAVITLNLDKKFQTITGFGGSFTEASAHLYSKLG